MRFLVMSLFALLLLVVSTAAQDVASEEQALREMWGRFEEFYNQGDAQGVAGLYASDADRTNTRGEVAHGRAEVQEMYAARMAEREAMKVVSLSLCRRT